MNALFLLSLLSLIPIIYPLRKFWKRDDINFFDLLIIFNSLHFAFTPLTHYSGGTYMTDLVIIESLIYASYIGILYYFDISWTKRKGQNRNNIINISLFLKKIDTIHFNTAAKALVFLSLFYLVSYYLPRMSIAVRMEELTGAERSYEEGALAMAMGPLISILNVLLTIRVVTDWRKGYYTTWTLVALVIFYVFMFFMPRRAFLGELLCSIIVLYSIYRKTINKKFIMIGIGAGLFLWLVYFPFYNVFRWSPVKFDSKQPVESLVGIIEYGIDNYSLEKDDAAESSEKRTMGLYDAIYQLLKASPEPQYGSLTAEAVDVAIPRIFNPGKGNGSEEPLEKLTKQNNDIADSFLLLGVGDFLLFGGIYAALLYIVIARLYSLYCNIFYKKLKVMIVPLFFIGYLITWAWNIENKVDGSLSVFFGSIFALLLMVIIEKSKCITIVKL